MKKTLSIIIAAAFSISVLASKPEKTYQIKWNEDSGKLFIVQFATTINLARSTSDDVGHRQKSISKPNVNTTSQILMIIKVTE